MQGLRLKFGDRRNSDWRCCFCCHVRTGTIFLGMWHLMLQVLCLSIIAVILRNPEQIEEWDQDQDQEGQIMMPTPVPQGDGEFRHNVFIGPRAMPSQNAYGVDVPPKLDLHNHHLFSRNFTHRKIREDLNVLVVVLFCSFGITLLMVFGAIRGKPSYLMPFFCLQMFDFCISSLFYLFYLPDLHHHLVNNPCIPFRDELLRLEPQVLSLVVLLGFTIAMMVKTYFIGVVWSCYKYLTLRMVASRRTIHYIDTDNRMMSQSLLTDLPDYETAVKKFPTPPPSYDLATATAPPPPPPFPQPSAVPGVTAVQVLAPPSTRPTPIGAPSASGLPTTAPDLIAPAVP